MAGCQCQQSVHPWILSIDVVDWVMSALSLSLSLSLIWQTMTLCWTCVTQALSWRPPACSPVAFIVLPVQVSHWPLLYGVCCCRLRFVEVAYCWGAGWPQAKQTMPFVKSTGIRRCLCLRNAAYMLNAVQEYTRSMLYILMLAGLKQWVLRQFECSSLYMLYMALQHIPIRIYIYTLFLIALLIGRQFLQICVTWLHGGTNVEVCKCVHDKSKWQNVNRAT